jgi:hypothetical protein
MEISLTWRCPPRCHSSTSTLLLFSPLKCLLPKQIFPYITAPLSTRLIEFAFGPHLTLSSAVNQRRASQSHASRCPPRSLCPDDHSSSFSSPRPSNSSRNPCRGTLCRRIFTLLRIHLRAPPASVSLLLSPTIFQRVRPFKSQPSRSEGPQSTRQDVRHLAKVQKRASIVQRRQSNVLKLSEEHDKLKEELRAMTERLEAAERRRQELESSREKYRC